MTIYQIDVTESRRLVFGMQWQGFVDSKAQKAARKIANERRATHYLLAVDGRRVSESLGTVALKGPNRLDKGVEGFSAAQAFARQHPQGIVCLVARLDDQNFWYVASRSGNVLAKSDVVTSKEVALDFVKDLQARHGNALKLVFLHDAIESLSIDDFAQHMNEQTQLVQLGFSFSSIPKPVIVIFWILTALVGVRELHTQWRKYDDRQRLKQLAEAGVDPTAAWADALAAFAKSNPVTSPAAFSAVIDSILAVPLRIDRWTLQRTECQSASDQWHCSSEYQRGPLGTNEAFDSARPQHWRVSWSPLNRAIGSFSVPGGFVPLDIGALPDLASVEEQTISRLQRIEPAFTSIVTKAPVPVVVPPPSNGNGQFVPMPIGGLQLKEIDVAFSGPLRSALLIDEEITRRVAWTKVSVQVTEKPDVGIRTSQLVTQLNGSIYAK